MHCGPPRDDRPAERSSSDTQSRRAASDRRGRWNARRHVPRQDGRDSRGYVRRTCGVLRRPLPTPTRRLRRRAPVAPGTRFHVEHALRAGPRRQACGALVVGDPVTSSSATRHGGGTPAGRRAPGENGPGSRGYARRTSGVPCDSPWSSGAGASASGGRRDDVPRGTCASRRPPASLPCRPPPRRLMPAVAAVCGDDADVPRGTFACEDIDARRPHDPRAHPPQSAHPKGQVAGTTFHMEHGSADVDPRRSRDRGQTPRAARSQRKGPVETFHVERGEASGSTG